MRIHKSNIEYINFPRDIGEHNEVVLCIHCFNIIEYSPEEVDTMFHNGDLYRNYIYFIKCPVCKHNITTDVRINKKLMPR